MTGPRSRRGAVAALSAVVMVPVIGFAGLAVDLTRVWLVSARLKTSVDAASLVAARTMTSTTRDADTRAIFWANYTMNGRSARSHMLATPNTTVEITPIGTTRIRVTARADVPTTLFGIISRNTTPLVETSLAEREGTGLELAIAIDQTSSMRERGSSGMTKLELAQEGTTALLDILYGTEDTKRNMWVSVVPFARTINIGTANASLLSGSGLPASWNGFGNQWAGCVEARRGGHDVTDTAPTSDETRFPPYYWDTTYRQVGWVSGDVSNTVANLARNAAFWQGVTGAAAYNGEGLCTSGNAYGPVAISLYANTSTNSRTTYNVRFCRGANDWRDLSDTLNPTRIRTLSTSSGNAAYNPMFAYLRNEGFGANGFTQESAAGPNMLCALTPVLPLTASRRTIQQRVDAIVAPAKSGGTTVVTGMQGLWYNLSPDWRNRWDGIATSGELGALPVNYGTRNMMKVAVILTDGDNNWQPPYQYNSGTVRDSARGTNWYTDLMYNAYGRRTDYNTNVMDFNAQNVAQPAADIAETTSGSSQQQANADARLDQRFAAICGAMKAQGITLYVVGLEVTQGSAIDTMLATCASSSRTYIRARVAEDIPNAFREIANQLVALRLVE
ncbi:pilus assembly protein [Roseomonas sp. JC162]|uniref:Pilus assembly protein n=1 Tax=Neoroseomonas marina TaxID=1232220 RepID=A0A848E8L1_9PROT|nr:TadE/TadG family type IV pilus assembly protein [Neoroseomonas marina]NMJ39917.1 pilus assembly protein [Neoroseomonas marina]